MIRIAVDCFGGDHGPEANVDGALLALQEHADLKILLTGDETKIGNVLKNRTYDRSRLTVLHAPEVIGCDEVPTAAIKQKPDSSLMRAIELLRTDESVCGMVSAGSTGALVAASALRIGRIHGVKRPAFCPVLPTMNGGVVGVCDSGANVDVTPKMLCQFALMGSLYLSSAYGIASPRVALLNIGTEAEKGDELRKAAYPMLAALDGVNFVGNMESRDLLSGGYDLVVCDGFSGNVLLKSTEGACLEMLKKLKRDIYSRPLYQLGALLMKRMFDEEKRFMDYRNYGGSVLLGCKKSIVKGHGSSNDTAIRVCIEQAYRMEKAGMAEKLSRFVAALNEREP